MTQIIEVTNPKDLPREQLYGFTTQPEAERLAEQTGQPVVYHCEKTKAYYVVVAK